MLPNAGFIAQRIALFGNVGRVVFEEVIKFR